MASEYIVEVVLENKPAARDPVAETIKRDLIAKKGYNMVSNVRSGQYLRINIMAENESDDPDDTLDDEDEDYTDEDEEIPEEDENNYEEEDYDEENIVEDSIKSMNEEKQKNIIKRPKIPIIKKARRVERPTVNI